MYLLILGLFVGSCLGGVLMAILGNSKQADEAVCRFMEEKDGAAHKGVLKGHNAVV